MKLKDCILKSVIKYPTLYLTPTYQDSRLLVLHQLFLVLGNGVEWADTGDLKTGGYMVHPNYVRNLETDEWDRVKDLPYGQEKFEESGKWDNIIKLGIAEAKKDHKAFMKRMPHLRKYYKTPVDNKVDNYEFRFNSIFRKGYHPYPFATGFWPFSQIDPVLIQPDWRKGMLDIFEWALTFFEDKERVHSDDYYGSEKWNTDGCKKYVEKYHPDKTWPQILKEYEMEEFNINPFDWKDFEEKRSERDRLKYIADLKNAIQILQKIAEKKRYERKNIRNAIGNFERRG